MIAVDTNVLIRLLTGDDLKRAAAARSLFASGPIWIAKTVAKVGHGYLPMVLSWHAGNFGRARTLRTAIEGLVERDVDVGSWMLVGGCASRSNVVLTNI